MNSKNTPKMSAQVPNWTENLSGIKRAVQSASGSQVLICVYDSPQTLAKMLDDIQALASEIKIPFARLHIDESNISTPQALLGKLDKTKSEERGLAVVTGVYVWLRDDEANARNIRQLNIYRDYFVGFVPPIQTLFFIPEQLIGRFRIDCPDFWAYQSGLFLFQSQPEERAAQTEEFSKLPDWRDTLSGEQKRVRIKQIELAIANTIFDTVLEKRLLVDILTEKGRLENELGEYGVAQKTYNEALAIAEQYKFTDRESLIINNIGTIFEDLGKHKEAITYFERALDINKAYYGNNNQFIAICLNNIGGALQSLGDYDGAKKCYEQALEIDKNIYGMEHPNIAIRLNNIGGVLQDIGDFKEAKKYYEQALSINLSVYGEKHPLVAKSFNNIGNIRKALEDYEGAMEYYNRALRINEDVYGYNHPTIAIVLNNIGQLLELLGDNEGALKCLEKSVSIEKEVYGEEHPNIAIRYNNIGYALFKLGDYRDAETNYKRAYEIASRFYGADHPLMMNIMRSLEQIEDIDKR